MALGVTSKCWKTVGNLHATIGEVNTERASPLKLKDSQNQTKLKKRLKEKESEFLRLQKVRIACMVKTKRSPPALQGKTFHTGTEPSSSSQAALSKARELAA